MTLFLFVKIFIHFKFIQSNYHVISQQLGYLLNSLSILIIIQVYEHDRKTVEVTQRRVLMINPSCKNIEYPANGECRSGWYYYNGTEYSPDLTVTMECTGTLLLDFYLIL